MTDSDFVQRLLLVVSPDAYALLLEKIDNPGEQNPNVERALRAAGYQPQGSAKKNERWAS